MADTTGMVTRVEEYRVTGRAYMRTRAEAKAKKDGARLEKEGWVPVSAQWSPDKPGCLIPWSSSGKLTVTYARPGPSGTDSIDRSRPVQVAPQASAPQPAPSDPVAALQSLADMRDRGLITAEEYDAKKADLLSRM